MDKKNLMEAMKSRHSVRQYQEQPISTEILSDLRKLIEECNKKSGLHFQMVEGETEAFNGFMAHYGKFSGVSNYIALIGKKESGIEEKVGYYGEYLVLNLQQMGLNSCWVGLTYKKTPGAFALSKEEKLFALLPFGYGKTQGMQHKSKSLSQVSNLSSESPQWFRAGVEAALLAPTSMNQQKFMLTLSGNHVVAKAGRGINTKIDLGIVKQHFELGAGIENFKWK